MLRLFPGLLMAAALLAQETPTFHVDVDVVNVLATVRDRDGRVVSDLTKDDFILEEDGKPQDDPVFARQTDLPLTVGLLVDTSMSQQRLIETERRASHQFFEQVLRPEGDMAFVIQFDVEVELLQDHRFANAGAGAGVAGDSEAGNAPAPAG